MILISEENVISLRTAIVFEDRGIVSLYLTSRAETFGAHQTPNHVKHDVIWLYRNRKSFLGETLARLRLYSLEKNIKTRTLGPAPEIGFKWADCGNSVAVILAGDPWAFILEGKNHGYSKGISKRTICNPWEQALFDATFKT